MSSTLRTRLTILLACSLAGAIAGCDGDPMTTDAGEDAGTPPVDDAGNDAALPDTTAPEVSVTIPRDGDVEIDPATTIRIVFSEPIDPASGTISAAIDDVTVALGTPTASADAREITLSPVAPLPGNASVSITIDGFSDLAGNAMAAPHVFTFATSDPFAPTVTSATPAEGASAIDPEITTITIDFSEVMNAALGGVTLEGGPGTIGAPTWSGAQATFTVSGLAPDTAYHVELIGFSDPAGNALDGTAYLGNGALDFTTGPDAIAPVVTESSPSEGAAAIAPTRTTRLRVVFSEPMDTTAGTATLGTAVLEELWTGGGTILTLDVTGLLEADSSYQVALDGFTDVAGNALDGAVYLGDSVLDFATGGDELPPFVLYSNPAEGATGIRWTTDSIFVTFSEGMDTTITNIPVTDGVSSTTWTGTWSSGGALLTFDVDGLLISGRSYVLDFTALDDADGLPLDASHSYLGDGRLAFTTDAPRGENCQDFLTNAQATTTAGRLTWTIANTAVTNVDGAAPCDASGGSADAVVRYTKTTPDSTDAGGAGTVLRITVSTTATTSPELNVDVLRDACDPTSSAARLSCVTNAEPQVLELDVPAGEYFVWVASSTGAFDGVTVEIEEVPAGLGDTCRNAIPITTGMTSITPTGAQSLQGPSCSASNLTWYRYTTTQGLGVVRAGDGRALGARERLSGQPLLCRSGGLPLPVMAAPGTEVCIAVDSGTATTLSIEELPYDGVRGIASDTGITIPTGYFSPSLTCLIATPTRLYTAGTDLMAVAPTTGGELTEFDPDPSLPGDQGVAIGEAVYTISDATFNVTTPNSLVYQLVDSTGTPLAVPLAIDTSPSYMATQKLGTMAVDIDGTSFILVQDTPTTAAPTYFYSLPIAGGAPVLLGRNDTLQDVAAVAVDATYIYVTANISDTSTEGIYRIRRDELSNPAATPVLLYGGGLNYSDANGAMYLDSLGGRTWMYFRTYGPADVHLLLDPDTATPTYLGTLWTTTSDNRTGMAYDPAIPALFVLDHAPTPDQWVRIE